MPKQLTLREQALVAHYRRLRDREFELCGYQGDSVTYTKIELALFSNDPRKVLAHEMTDCIEAIGEGVLTQHYLYRYRLLEEAYNLL